MLFYLVYRSFHDNDRPIYNNSEVNSAERHQVGPYPKNFHQTKSKQQRERNQGSRNESAAEAAKQEHEYKNNDECTFDQVFFNSMCGSPNEFAEVKKRIYFQTFR